MTIEQIADRFMEDANFEALSGAIPGVRITEVEHRACVVVLPPNGGSVRRGVHPDCPRIVFVRGVSTEASPIRPLGAEMEGYGTTLAIALHSLHAGTSCPEPLR